MMKGYPDLAKRPAAVRGPPEEPTRCPRRLPVGGKEQVGGPREATRWRPGSTTVPRHLYASPGRLDEDVVQITGFEGDAWPACVPWPGVGVVQIALTAE